MTTLYPIINCVRCGQVFRQILRDLCPECIAVEDENAAKIARLLKASAPEGGLSLEDLSSQALIPADDVMALYEEGFFHDEARWLLRSCHKCLETFPVTECHGDCCAACFETIQREVGDDLRLHDALRQQEAMAWDGRRHYGLKKGLNDRNREYYKF